MTPITRPLERVINEALRYDPGARQRLAQLVGHSIVLSMQEPTLTLALLIEEDADGVHIRPQFSEPEQVDARVSGRAMDLLAVLQAPDRTQAMMSHRIKIEGDTRTFFMIQDILSDLNIDWEMALGDRLGDLPAHVMADGLRLVGGFLKAQGESVDRTVKNYLREETQWLVPQPLWRAHSDRVHELRMAAERLQARLERLERRRSASGRGGPDS